MSIQRRRSRHLASCVLPVLLGSWFGLAPFEARAEGWHCTERPVEACFNHHGRLSSQNGIPLTIWLIGTKRRVGLANNIDELPAAIQRYLTLTSPDHSYIYGDFEICPLEPDTPGRLRRVCVVSGEKLVVKILRGPRPAFRLLSTWPSAESSRR